MIQITDELLGLRAFGLTSRQRTGFNKTGFCKFYGFLHLMLSLSRLFGRDAQPVATEIALPSLSEPLFVIGDIHGCRDQLESLLEMIWQSEGYDARIITVGDMIDRGPDSNEVLQRLGALHRVSGSRLTCLKGNHEQMMLDFLSDPRNAGVRWIHAGGLDTLESFGISSDGKGFEEIAGELQDRLGPDMMHWLRGLPSYWEESNVAVVHAGADPALPLAEQTENTLYWGHKDFRSIPRADGKWIIHGHTIVKEPRIKDGRISIDTGAYRGMPLTAVAVGDGKINFLQA